MIPANAIAWPFAIGGSRMSERWEWATDVLPPPFGPTQTRKLRQAPRITLNFDGLERARRRRIMEHLLAMNTAGLWHAPLAVDTTELDESIAANADTIPVSTVGRRFRIDGNAILIAPNHSRHEVVWIDTFTETELQLHDPTTQAWPAGTLLIPTVASHVEPPELERFTGDEAPYSISFVAREPIDWPLAEDLPTYVGTGMEAPVLERAIDWDEPPLIRHDRLIEQEDNLTGPPVLFDLAGYPRPHIEASITLPNREAIAQHMSLLHTLRGRGNPIWVPTFGQDLLITEVVSDILIDVENIGYASWVPQSNRMDIRVQWRGGPPIYRRIAGASVVDEDTERLFLPGDGWPPGFSLDQVEAVSFMAFCLQDADVNLLRHWTTDVVLTELGFNGCSDAELVDYDGGAG